MQKRVATTKTVFIEIILKPSLNNWNKTIIFLKNSPSLQPFLKRMRLTIRTYNYCEDSSFIPPEAELIKKVKANGVKRGVVRHLLVVVAVVIAVVAIMVVD